MDDNKWVKLHSIYLKQDWINKPCIFATEAIEYFPEHGSILEIGAGHGQDGIYFSSLGFKVICTDLKTASLRKNVSDTNVNTKDNIIVKRLDLRQPFKFEEKFDVVYAHLSLHYFNHKTTERIFVDIYRALKPNGVLAFLVNSTEDPEYRTSNKIEEYLYEVGSLPKRYFTTEEAKKFAHRFNPLLVDNGGETYKDTAIGVHHLIRFVGQKLEV